ncbi:hypothetical protein D9613_009592 [Agrocybe pediades]|uniref:C3H1-type domain-containing protein n=1 Tax=Agrocybe pediades TaxID=84607 RepID=A0A8H4VU99_9AGAR|nr:hypothetical protein D9613_009592 [Agrocybe pediades]
MSSAQETPATKPEAEQPSTVQEAPVAEPAKAPENGAVPPATSEGQETSAPAQIVETSTATETAEVTPAPSVTVVLSAPKTTEELIAARALKRVARKTAVREKAEGHKKAGDILFDSKNYKAAYQQYIEAIQLWGSNIEYYISLATAYRKLTWYEEAAHAATRALTLDPKNAEARYIRGVARLEQRLLKPAKIDFETVLEHNPSHLLARAALTEVNHFIATSTHLGTHELGPDPVEEAVKDVDFGFPHYDFEALEVDELSDSSDCNHVGNGVQCRFYNHEGCARGTACVFSHAPDEKSVRDELGKNVCIYHLLDSCKFGATKCIYSHSKDALPKRGWWTSPEQIAKVKSVMEVAEKNNREQRQLENERWRAHLKAMKASGKPPKSAGVKGHSKKPKAEKQSKEATETDGEAAGATDGEPPKSAGLEKEKRRTHKKKDSTGKPARGRPRAKSAAKKKTNGAGPKSPTAAASNAEGSGSAAGANAAQSVTSDAASKASETPAFTDYQPIAPPPVDVAPQDSATLPY